VRDEGRLLVERVREAEVGELAEDRVARRHAAGLRGDTRRGRLDKRSGRRPRRVAVELEPDPAGSGDGVQVDHGGDVVPEGRVGGEVGRAERAERAAVGRHEQDRVVRVERAGRDTGRRPVRACELDQHRRPRRVVVRAATTAVVVAVGHHDDRARRAPDCFGDEVLHLHAAVAGYDGGEALGPDRQPIRRELLLEPLRGPERAGKAVRVVLSEVGRELFRRLPVELRQERARQRRRACDAERGDEQRQTDEQPRPSVEAPVDRPLH
jgi:hypothetical protein